MSSRRRQHHLFFSLVFTVFVWLPIAFSDDRRAKIPGDIIIGGLFPAHKKGTGNSICGGVDVQGFQRLEAMLYTIDHINNDSTILPGIKLGTELMDTCRRPMQALDQTLAFFQTFKSSDASEYECDDGSQPTNNYTSHALAGMIGPAASSISIQVAGLLKFFRFPQVSYASTNSMLSDKTQFTYFLRTVPPDSLQVMAIIDIVRKFNWTYVSTVASSGKYGEGGIAYFMEKASSKNICIATSVKVPPLPVKESFDLIIKKLLETRIAKVVILFVQLHDAKGVLDAATRMNVTKHFLWLASDAWGREQLPVTNNEITAAGALTIGLTAPLITEFDDYFQKLNPHQNTRNPWIYEYWEKLHNCKWKSMKANITLENEVPKRVCIGNETFYPEPFVQISAVPFIYDAVYAVAHALHKMQQDVCPKTNRFCKRMKTIDGEEFLKKYLLKISFDNGYGHRVQFDENGDASANYSVYNFGFDIDTDRYVYKTVGTWSDNILDLNTDGIMWKDLTFTAPISQCSSTCSYYEVKSTKDMCCWLCIPCEEWEYKYDDYTCKDCGIGRWPDAQRQKCIDLVPTYLIWSSSYGIISIILACIGIICTVATIVIFARNNDSEVVKASNREVSYILFVGCLLSYATIFPFVAKPSKVSCTGRRIGTTLSFAIIFSALLTKVDFISRIFNNRRPAPQLPPFISPRAQVTTVSILITIQIVFTVVLLVEEPPGTKTVLVYSSRTEPVLTCKVKGLSFFISLAYVIILSIITTIYAYKGRKISTNSNETKLIGISMYFINTFFFVFMSVYFAIMHLVSLRSMFFCLLLFLCTSAVIFCVFVPKLYVILSNSNKLNVSRAVNESNRSSIVTTDLSSTDLSSTDLSSTDLSTTGLYQPSDKTSNTAIAVDSKKSSSTYSDLSINQPTDIKPNTATAVNKDYQSSSISDERRIYEPSDKKPNTATAFNMANQGSSVDIDLSINQQI